MSRNPAYGEWTEEQTNWSKADLDFVRDALNEKPVPTSYEELLKEYKLGLTT